MGRDRWSGTAAPRRPALPHVLPTSAVSAREPDGAHAIGSPTGQAWPSPCSPSLASWKSHASQAGRAAAPPADPGLRCPPASAHRHSPGFQAYARETKPNVRVTFRSVGIGKPSRTVQRWPCSGPIFQVCRPASVAVYGLGSSFGSSRTPCLRLTRLRMPSVTNPSPKARYVG